MLSDETIVKIANEHGLGVYAPHANYRADFLWFDGEQFDFARAIVAENEASRTALPSPSGEDDLTKQKCDVLAEILLGAGWRNNGDPISRNLQRSMPDIAKLFYISPHADEIATLRAQLAETKIDLGLAKIAIEGKNNILLACESELYKRDDQIKELKAKDRPSAGVEFARDELLLIESVLRGFDGCIAKTEGLRAVRKLLTASPVVEREQLSDEQIIEIAYDIERSLPDDSEDGEKLVAVVRACLAQESGE